MTILTYLHNTIFIATQTSMCRCRVIIWMHYALFNPLPTDGQLRFSQLHVLIHNAAKDIIAAILLPLAHCLPRKNSQTWECLSLRVRSL